ncbi:MAG: flagellar basal body-associated protein FliL [Pseudomonadota bacterium]
MKAEPKAEIVAPANSKKKLIVIIAALAVLAAGGGGAWFMLKGGDEDAPVTKTKSKSKHKEKAAGPPVFVPIEPFTVNLQPENGEQYLQLAFTLQVSSLEEVEIIKTNMPKVRSRLLLLLSGKKASEINTPEGKQQLSAEIIEQVKLPFEDKGSPQEVTEVLFTSFIIQ